MRVLNSTTKNEPIDAIKPHPRNPRQGDIGAIHQSIQTNGFYGTIIAQKSTGYILAGNHRWQAARQTKTKTIPVTWLDVDDDHALRILLADNRTNDLATYNDNMLSELLQDLHNATGTLDGTGYTGDDLDDLLAQLANNQTPEEPAEPQIDKAEELRKKWDTAPGQLWLVGPHRIICGDSTNKDVISRLLAGKKVDAVITDPPYGMAAVETSGVLKKRYKPIVGDQDTHLAAKSVKQWSSVKQQIWWGANYYVEALGPSPCWLVWNKNNGASDQMDAELAWTNLSGVTRMYTLASERGKGRYHPTQKPTSLAQWCLQKTNGLVIDPFIGAGWTVAAASLENRTCYGVEIDPSYVAVTLQRLADMGLTPKLID